MLRRLFVALSVVSFLLSTAYVAKAATPEEAKAVVKEFIEYAKKHGMDAAMKEVKPDGLFGVGKRGEAYIFVFDNEGRIIVHGANPKLNGKNLYKVKDSKGKQFVKEFIEVANTKGSGFVSYYWPHPKTKKIMPKVSFIEKYDGYIVGAGVYKH